MSDIEPSRKCPPGTSACDVQPAAAAEGDETCPPSLAATGTALDEFVSVPEGKRTRIFSTSANETFDIAGDFGNSRWFLEYEQAQVGCGSCKGYVTLLPAKVSARLKERFPVPVVSGIAFNYERPKQGLEGTTHVELKVSPKTKGYLILEIYDGDGPDVSVEKSKDPGNHWLPRKDVDLFKIRIPIEPSKGWRTLTVPLDRFIDWNRKRESCDVNLKGVNEDIGDGVLNVRPKERFQFQIVLEAEDYDVPAYAYVHPYVKFVRYDKGQSDAQKPNN